jgi:hypothetical protein
VFANGGERPLSFGRRSGRIEVEGSLIQEALRRVGSSPDKPPDRHPPQRDALEETAEPLHTEVSPDQSDSRDPGRVDGEDENRVRAAHRTEDGHNKEATPQQRPKARAKNASNVRVDIPSVASRGVWSDPDTGSQLESVICFLPDSPCHAEVTAVHRRWSSLAGPLPGPVSVFVIAPSAA